MKKNNSAQMNKHIIGAERLIKTGLITFIFSTLASFAILAAFSYFKVAGVAVETRQILSLSCGLGLLQAVGITTALCVRFLRPLCQLEEEMAAVAADPELILPKLGHSTRHNQDIQRLRSQILNLSEAVRQTIRQRQRLADIGEAVAKINHDLRNMLASAMLVIDQLENSNDPRVSEAAPVVIKATEQASALCQNMLDYLTELPQPEPETLNLSALTAELEQATNLQISWRGPDRLYVDKMMFHRLLFNLARNADQAGASRLSIDVWQAGHLAVIDVSDNGPGIPQHLRQTLFRAFASGQPTGYGLGLAICLDMALALGGRLRLSRSTEDGSEFRLQLPASCLQLQD